MMQRFDFDWYSPTRLVDSSSIKYDFPGDRFIPNRSLMDLSHAQTLMTSKTPEKKKDNADSPEKSKFNDEYRRRVQENLDLDSEGRPFRMLVFRGSPVSSRKSIRQIDELLQQERLNARMMNTKPMRCLPKSAHRILDAPGFIDNYYLNLIDWGNNNVLAVALQSILYMWNANQSKVEKLMEANADGDGDYPTSVAWSESAKTVAVGLSSSKVQLWDAEKCQLVRSLEGHQRRVGCLAWKGQSLTSGSQDKSIIHHDVRSRNSLTSRLKAHSDEICGLKWSSRGNQLASGGNDNTVHIWEASSMHSSKPLQKFTDHRAAVKALAWSPHQYDVLASGGGTEDRCIKIWNSQNGKCLSSTDTKSQICGLEWNRYEKEILTGHGYSQNSLCLWKYPSMTKMADLKGQTARIINVCQSPDGLTVASAVADETLRFWNIFERPKTTTEADTESLLSLKRYQIR